MKAIPTGFAAAAALAAAALAQPPRPMDIKLVEPGVYVVAGNGGNSVLVIGTDGVVLVDTKSPGRANFEELNAKIRSVTALPIKQVLVTHHHADHSGNIGLFEATGAPVAGQAGMARALQAVAGPDGAKASPPNVTFADRLAIKAGGVSAEARHFAAAHTGDDSIVYFPALKLVAAGDEVDDDKPNIDFPGGGSIAGWLASLDSIAAIDFDLLIPGHGPAPMTKAQFLAFRDKARTLAARARAAIKAGVPKDRLLASIKTDDLGWSITTPVWQGPGIVDGLYAELSK